jgi:hypothetical protein
VTDQWDALDDRALENYLRGAGHECDERFYLEERDGEWVAEFRSPNNLAGEVVSVRARPWCSAARSSSSAPSQSARL